jgi:hypothetical protein
MMQLHAVERGVRRTRLRPSAHLLRIVLFSAGHFALAMIIAIIAFGSDLDQLRSRSPWSRAAAVVHDVLWFPHDATLRALPNDWLSRNLYAIPLALVLNSLVWGTVLYALWESVRRVRKPLHARPP